MGCGASLSEDNIAKYKANPQKYAEKAAMEERAHLVSEAVNPVLTKKPIAAVITQGSVFREYTIEDRALLKRQHFCLATHKTTEKLRACRKMIKVRVDAERIRDEIDIMSVLDHPNILKLHEVFEDKLHYYFIEDHCRGGRLLEQLVVPGSDMPDLHHNEPLVAHILKQVLRGISYMHASHVCHRNLEFQRLLVLESGVGKDPVPLHRGTIIIADFTLACRFEKGGTMREDIREWAFWSILAPEILIGGRYTHLCDLWACGAGTYWLLSGEMPFEGDDPDEIVSTIAGKTGLYDSVLWKNVSAPAKELLSLLLCRNVEKRCTAQEALVQPWLSQDLSVAEGFYRAGKKEDASAFDIVSKLKAFYEQSQLQKKVMQVIAHNLADDEIRGLGKTFLDLDTNNDGVVTVAELSRGILKMSGKLEGEPQLQDLMRIMGAHERKYIEYTEFLAAVMDEKYYQQDSFALVAFRYFDTNGDKQITPKELLNALAREEAQENVDDPMFKALRRSVMQSIKRFDGDGNKCIDFREFTDMLRGNRDNSQAMTGSMSMTASKTIKQLSPGTPKAAGKQKKGCCYKCGKESKLRFVPRCSQHFCTACALEEM